MTDIDELFGAFDEAPATQTPDERGAARKRSRSEDDAERAPPQPRPAVRVTDPVKEDGVSGGRDDPSKCAQCWCCCCCRCCGADCCG